MSPITKLIEKALEKAGYTHVEPTEANLIDCFKDYADSGVWHELDLDTATDWIESGTVTVKEICHALINLV